MGFWFHVFCVIYINQRLVVFVQTELTTGIKMSLPYPLHKHHLMSSTIFRMIAFLFDCRAHHFHPVVCMVWAKAVHTQGQIAFLTYVASFSISVEVYQTHHLIGRRS